MAAAPRRRYMHKPQNEVEHAEFVKRIEHFRADPQEFHASNERRLHAMIKRATDASVDKPVPSSNGSPPPAASGSPNGGGTTGSPVSGGTGAAEPGSGGGGASGIVGGVGSIAGTLGALLGPAPQAAPCQDLDNGVCSQVGHQASCALACTPCNPGNATEAAFCSASIGLGSGLQCCAGCLCE